MRKVAGAGTLSAEFFWVHEKNEFYSCIYCGAIFAKAHRFGLKALKATLAHKLNNSIKKDIVKYKKMNLLHTFLPKSDFSTYEDFEKDFKLKLPDSFNFAFDVVDLYAQKAPSQRALVWCNDAGESKEFTFKELSDLSKLAADFLMQKGIGTGNVVMLSLHRRYEYWIFILALHRLGAVAFPVSSQLTSSDIAQRSTLGKVRLFINQDFLKEEWEPYLQSHPDFQKSAPDLPRPKVSVNDPMLLYYTSGTEGEPKPVIHNWLYPLAHIITAKYWQKTYEDGLHYSVAETGWAKASWGKIYGQWICGAAVFVYDRQGFNPQSILQKISDYGVNTFCAPPVIYRYLVEQDFSKYDLKNLKHCCSAGEALDAHVAQKFYEKSGLKIFEGYGQTESALLCANFDFDENSSAPSKACLSSLGKPSPLYKISLVDSKGKKCGPKQTGEIVIDLSKNHPVGLFTNCNLPTDSKLYHTGDLAYYDSEGYFYFIGRKDDIIKSAGFRISPHEVEAVINRHPAVLESAVYSKTDAKRGQIVIACIVLKEGFVAGKKLEQELSDFIRQNTALYKCPRKIEFVKELAKTYNGKIFRGKKSQEENVE